MKNDSEADRTARETHQRGQKKRQIWATARKVKGRVKLESIGEVKTLYLIDIDPRILKVSTQPCTFDLKTMRQYRSEKEAEETIGRGGYKPTLYTPDFALSLADKSTAFIDSKHSAHITKKPEYLEYPKIFATAGERLIIVTENVTRSAAAENAKYLNRYGMELKPNFPDPTSEIPGTTFEIADLLSLHGLSNREIMYALLSGHLHVDLTKEAISPKTTVHRGTGSKNHLEIFPL